MTQQQSGSFWHVAFLVRRFPKRLFTSGFTHFFANLGPAFFESLKSAAETNDSLKAILLDQPVEGTDWACFRVEADDENKAISHARNRLDGLIDGISLLDVDDPPSVLDWVWVSRSSDTDLKLVVLHSEGWAVLQNCSAESREFIKRREALLEALVVRFCSIAVEQNSLSGCALAQQIRYSLRMYRFGAQAKSWGVEFLCKFSALEGLICGPESSRKKQMMIRRLRSLFRSAPDDVECDVTELWKLRNAAVHTAQVFDSGSLDEGINYGVNLEKLSRFFVAIVYFSLERLVSREVEVLWDSVGDFTLPPEFEHRRPNDMPRYACKDFVRSFGIRMQGGNAPMTEGFLRAREAFDRQNKESSV